jgi:hypothetical protein
VHVESGNVDDVGPVGLDILPELLGGGIPAAQTIAPVSWRRWRDERGADEPRSLSAVERVELAGHGRDEQHALRGQSARRRPSNAALGAGR